MPSHDVMPNMELYQPVQVEDALTDSQREAGWSAVDRTPTVGSRTGRKLPMP